MLKLLIGIMFISMSAQGNWIDEQDLRPDYQEQAKKFRSNLTEVEFKQWISELQNVYQPIVQALGGKLSIAGDWKSDKPNAAATQMMGSWQVKTTGGLARNPLLTKDGFILILCHELGHHLGGFAMAPAALPIPGVTAWASNEGQADYFSTQACARKLWREQEKENSQFRSQVQVKVKKLCDANWSRESEQNLCYRTLSAVESMIATMASLMNKPMPDFITPDPAVVAKTNHSHPAVQCRLDTALQGALCGIEFDEKGIPGKNASGGVTGLDAEKEAAIVSCTTFSGKSVGLRPACWYKARM